MRPRTRTHVLCDRSTDARAGIHVPPFSDMECGDAETRRCGYAHADVRALGARAGRRGCGTMDFPIAPCLLVRASTLSPFRPSVIPCRDPARRAQLGKYVRHVCVRAAVIYSLLPFEKGKRGTRFPSRRRWDAWAEGWRAGQKFVDSESYRERATELVDTPALTAASDISRDSSARASGVTRLAAGARHNPRNPKLHSSHTELISRILEAVTVLRNWRRDYRPALRGFNGTKGGAGGSTKSSSR